VEYKTRQDVKHICNLVNLDFVLAEMLSFNIRQGLDYWLNTHSCKLCEHALSEVVVMIPFSSEC